MQLGAVTGTLTTQSVLAVPVTVRVTLAVAAGMLITLLPERVPALLVTVPPVAVKATE